MTELEKLMKRLERLDAELIANRDFLAKTNSMCFDEKTKEDVTACINSKLDLINWIREQNEEIVADTQHDKERESKMGIWDKAIVSAGMCAEYMTNVLNLTNDLHLSASLSGKRQACHNLRKSCQEFVTEISRIKELEKEKENDGND